MCGVSVGNAAKSRVVGFGGIIVLAAVRGLRGIVGISRVFLDGNML